MILTRPPIVIQLPLRQPVVLQRLKQSHSSLTLQYISDIHLEHKSTYPRIPIVSKYMALLGDIGNPFADNYKEFVRYVSENTDRVFLVPGNHEFWHHKQPEEKVHEELMSMCDKLKNVEYLSNKSIKFNNYNILGTTLWVPFYENKYNENVKWLTDNIVNTTNENTIVLSHYLPSFKLIVPKYWTKEYEHLQKQYASNLEHLMKPNVKFWLCGHSHSTNHAIINGVYCGINAYGHVQWKSDEEIISYIELND